MARPSYITATTAPSIGESLLSKCNEPMLGDIRPQIGTLRSSEHRNKDMSSLCPDNDHMGEALDEMKITVKEVERHLLE